MPDGYSQNGTLKESLPGLRLVPSTRFDLPSCLPAAFVSSMALNGPQEVVFLIRDGGLKASSATTRTNVPPGCATAPDENLTISVVLPFGGFAICALQRERGAEVSRRSSPFRSHGRICSILKHHFAGARRDRLVACTTPTIQGRRLSRTARAFIIGPATVQRADV